MIEDTTTEALFARCPLWLWPVLVVSLVTLRQTVGRLEDRGAAGWEIRINAWGWAHVARVWWPGARPHWKDSLYRTAMGEPVAAPSWQPAPLGLCTDDTSRDWACGTGHYARLRAAVLPSSESPLPLAAITGCASPQSGPQSGPEARLLHPP